MLFFQIVRVCVYVYFLVPGLIYPLFRINYYVCREKKLKSSIKKQILIRTRVWNGSSNTAELNEKKIARARKSNMILRLMWQNDSGVKCEEVGWKLSIKKWKRKFLMNKCVCFFISFLFTFVIYYAKLNQNMNPLFLYAFTWKCEICVGFMCI